MLSFERVDSADHPLIPAARELFEEYWRELDVDLCFQGFAEELASLPGKYAPPKGRLFIVLDDQEPIASGALRMLEDHICELKRIYVRPSHRGSGLGRSITVHLMECAREIGYTLVRLDTLRKLAAAQRLYQSLGFQETVPYNDAGEHDVVYFEREL